MIYDQTFCDGGNETTIRQVKSNAFWCYKIEMTIRFSLYPTIAWLLWHHIIPSNFIWRTQNQWQRKLSFLSFHLFWQIYWLVGSWNGNATPARLIWCLYSAKVFEYNTPQAFPTRPRRDIILRRNVIGNYVFHFFHTSSSYLNCSTQEGDNQHNPNYHGHCHAWMVGWVWQSFP